MTDSRMPLMELLQKAGEGDFLRTVAESVLNLLFPMFVASFAGVTNI